MGGWFYGRCAILAVAAACVLAPAAGEAAPKSTGKSGGKADSKKSDAKKSDAKTDPRVWMVVKADETYVLRFGLPRVADPVFAVSCQPGAQLIQFTAEVSSGKVKAGDGVALSLASGKRRLELAASAFRGSADGKVVVEAAVALDGRVLDLFSDADNLVVRLPGATETYPLAGAKPKLPDFRRVCLATMPAPADRR